MSAITIHGLEALLVGMITDTGSFKYSISPNTFKNAAGEIISQGGDIAHVQDMLYNHMPEIITITWSLLNQTRMNIYPDRKAGLIYL